METGLIDMHCHILPGLDDGAGSLEAAMRMAKAAVNDGIRTVIATPHRNAKYRESRETVMNRVRELNRALRRKHIPLSILPGQEIRTHAGMIRDLFSQAILRLNGSSYLLIELPPWQIPEELDDWIHELRLQGMTPIIAHPECNKAIAADPDKLYHYVEQGVLCQITAHSVTGAFGRKLQKLSIELCRRNLTHFVASDAHDTARRGFCLGQAYREIERILGYQYADYYRANSECLLYGQEIIQWEPLRRSKWFLFRKQEA